MAAVFLESLQKLTSEITNELLSEQEALQSNVKKLIVILRPQHTSAIDEEREANFRHSNTKASQVRRDDLYRSQMITIMREKKDMQQIFINFVAQQKEFLASKERQEQLRQEKEKQPFDEMFHLLGESDKRRLIELIAHIEKLSHDINKMIAMLDKIIGDLQRAFIADNLHFIANHETILRQGLEAIGERVGDRFYLPINGIQVQINMDELIQVFTTINEKAFHAIAEGNQVQISDLRAQAEFGVRTYLSKQANTENVEQAVSEVMALWDAQAEVLQKHIILQTERQQKTQNCIEIRAGLQEVCEHVEDIKAQATASGEPDLLMDLLNKGEECVKECSAIVKVEAGNVDLISRATSTLVALEKVVINEQTELTKEKIQETDHTKQLGGKTL